MRDLGSGAVIDPATLLGQIDGCRRLDVGDAAALDVLGRFASALLRPRLARQYPELASLGFFLRRAELRRLAALASAAPSDVLRVPRGLVFHVPPANVDTVFVYSWALSFVCGNANVVRVSERSAGAARSILDVLLPLLDDVGDPVHPTQRFVSMPHDDAGFAALSARCDLRVLWGGDAAVAAVRRHPLAPRSTELTFPDRSSMALLGANAVLDAGDDRLDSLAEGFVNDVWWFDQAACSSPRAMVWIGTAAETDRARPRWTAAVERVLERKGLGAEPAMAVQRRVSLYGTAIEHEGLRLELDHPRLSVARSPVLVRGWFGAGGFIDVTLSSVDELVPLVRPRDQTITHFGIGPDDLRRLVRHAAGRGIDRVVPIGEALQFGRHWDGHDLLGAMTRWVVVRNAAAANDEGEDSAG
jgi:hypothetical protein